MHTIGSPFWKSNILHNGKYNIAITNSQFGSKSVSNSIPKHDRHICTYVHIAVNLSQMC